MLSKQKDKKFDAVKMMREIRDNLSKKYQGKPELEGKDYAARFFAEINLPLDSKID